MSGYLLSVIGAILFCAIIGIVLPGGKTFKIVQAVSRMVCIVAILAPIPAFFTDGIQDFFGETSIEVDEEYIKYCSELRIEETEKNLEKQLKEKYGELSITLYWGWTEDLRGENIKVYEVGVYHDNISEETQRKIVQEIYDNLGVKAVFYERNI